MSIAATTAERAEKLYRLLPQVQRLRDAEVGQPLRELMVLFAAELQAIEEDIEQLYDDQFIETCADWAAPYIGDLIGYRPLHEGASPALGSPRADVANTIAFRRRKGTALMLEELARSVTGWPAHVAEFFEQLATTQYMNHPRLHALGTANLHSLPAMLAVDRLRDGDANRGAFNTAAHTADMRSPTVSRDGRSGGGRYGIPHIGVFIWRLQHFPLSGVPLQADPGDASGRRWRLNPLGCDTQLFRNPQPQPDLDTLSLPLHVPAPLTVRGVALAPLDDFGDGRSIVLLRPPALPGAPWVPVPAAEMVTADLRDVGGSWNHEAGIPADRIAVDPERGRVLLGSAVPATALRATFQLGFSRSIGAGEYERTPPGETLAVQRSAREGEALAPALGDLVDGGRLLIADSLVYIETPTITVNGVVDVGASGNEVVIAAADGARPLIAVGGDITLAIGERGRLVLDGVVISGGALVLAAAADTEARELILRDCTLVPGLVLDTAGVAVSPGTPSLVVAHPFAKVTLERCIVGALRVATEAELVLRDCIVDAGAASASRLRREHCRHAGREPDGGRQQRHRQAARADIGAGIEQPARRPAPGWRRLARPGVGRTNAGGLRALLLVATRFDRATALSLPAERRAPRCAAAVQCLALRAPGLHATARHDTASHPHRRRRRRRDRRDARADAAAARSKPPGALRRVPALRPCRRRVPRHMSREMKRPPVALLPPEGEPSSGTGEPKLHRALVEAASAVALDASSRGQLKRGISPCQPISRASASTLCWIGPASTSSKAACCSMPMPTNWWRWSTAGCARWPATCWAVAPCRKRRRTPSS